MPPQQQGFLRERGPVRHVLWPPEAPRPSTDTDWDLPAPRADDADPGEPRPERRGDAPTPTPRRPDDADDDDNDTTAGHGATRDAIGRRGRLRLDPDGDTNPRPGSATLHRRDARRHDNPDHDNLDLDVTTTSRRCSLARRRGETPVASDPPLRITHTTHLTTHHRHRDLHHPRHARPPPPPPFTCPAEPPCAHAHSVHEGQ